MRVVIGEDAPLLRVGLVQVLEEAGDEVVAAVGDAPALVEAVARHRPDLAVVDVRMPPGMADDGLAAAITIRGRWPSTNVFAKLDLPPGESGNRRVLAVLRWLGS